MNWSVNFSTKAVKQINKLGKTSQNAILALQLLVEDLKSKGPYPGQPWQNYGKLKEVYFNLISQAAFLYIADSM